VRGHRFGVGAGDEDFVEVSSLEKYAHAAMLVVMDDAEYPRILEVNEPTAVEPGTPVPTRMPWT
jgi:hypothetical protein